MDYKGAKKYLKVTDKEVAIAFGYKNAMSYNNSNHREKHAKAFTHIVILLKEREDERLGEMLTIYQKACKALKTLSIDTPDFIKYLKRL